MTFPFYLVHDSKTDDFNSTPLSNINAQANQTGFTLYLNKPSNALVSDLKRCSATFDWRFWVYLVYLCFVTNAQIVHLCTESTSTLGCWNLLEKLALIFLNSFHRKHILLKIIIKKLFRKSKWKNIKNKFSRSHTTLSQTVFHSSSDL